METDCALLNSPKRVGVSVLNSINATTSKPSQIRIVNKSSEKIVGKLGDTIAALAIQNNAAEGIWISQHNTTNDESYPDFYIGDTGMAIALLRIGLSIGSFRWQRYDNTMTTR